MKKPYLLSLTASKYKEIFLERVKVLEDSVEVKDVWLDPYPGHLSRFTHIPNDLEDDRWWIFTDTSDVLFQKPFDFSVVPADIEIIVCSEGMKFKDNQWFVDQLKAEQILLDLLANRYVYNMGCWAMKGHKVKEFVSFLDHKDMFSAPEIADQPLFNLWLMNEKIWEEQNMFTCLFDNLNQGTTQKTEKGYVNKSGELFTVVHANGAEKYGITEG